MKRQSSEWEKIIANEATDKKLISKICKQLMQLNTRKINKWDLIKLKSFFHNEGNYRQGEKTAFRMGENNSKSNN